MEKHQYMNAHKRFVNELSAPVRRYDQKLKEEHRRKTKRSQPVDTSSESKENIQSLLEEEFDKLFGSISDEDD